MVSLRGPHWLLIGDARWKLTLADGCGATGSSTLTQINIALSRLEGEKIVGTHIAETDGATQFRFDLGATLTVRRRFPLEEWEMWSYYRPNGRVLSIRGDGMYAHGAARRPEKWLPLAAAVLPN